MCVFMNSRASSEDTLCPQLSGKDASSNAAAGAQRGEINRLTGFVQFGRRNKAQKLKLKKY